MLARLSNIKGVACRSSHWHGFDLPGRQPALLRFRVVLEIDETQASTSDVVAQLERDMKGVAWKIA